jgi:hypothetical protein
MPYEVMIMTLIAAFSLGVAALLIVRKHLFDAKRLRLLELLHEERERALEKDLPLPTLEDGSLLGTWREPTDGHSRGILWLRLTALCIGLFMLVGGIGAVMGLALLPAPFVAAMLDGMGGHGGNAQAGQLGAPWSLGLIPTMMGGGLLLFYYLSRKDHESADAGYRGQPEQPGR